MPKNISVFLGIFILSVYSLCATSPYTVELARSFSKDLFESNGVPFMKPLIEIVNATSNSRFIKEAYIPKNVDEPYYKISINGMLGFVRDDMKTYHPTVNTEPFDWLKLTQFGSYDLVNKSIQIKDTAGLIYYFFKNILNSGIQGGKFKVPNQAATILGSQKAAIWIDRGVMDSLVKVHPVYPFLPKSFQDSITGIINEFPEFNTLPEGSNINAIMAMVPQLEIGSWMGTEMLVRFIPPVNLGKDIGDFAFWGIGLKHSISQYFSERYFDLAVQAVYQGTYLKNTVGFTKSELKANATILDFNIQASKKFDGLFDIYTGFSYENTKINSEFKYYISVETQQWLGLLDSGKTEPSPGFPGDQNPQTSSLKLEDNNYKWVIGISKELGNFRFMLDYNVSKFNIFSFAWEYKL